MVPPVFQVFGELRMAAWFFDGSDAGSEHFKLVVITILETSISHTAKLFEFGHSDAISGVAWKYRHRINIWVTSGSHMIQQRLILATSISWLLGFNCCIATSFKFVWNQWVLRWQCCTMIQSLKRLQLTLIIETFICYYVSLYCSLIFTKNIDRLPSSITSWENIGVLCETVNIRSVYWWEHL